MAESKNKYDNIFFENLFDAIPFSIYVADISSYELIFRNRTLREGGIPLKQGKCYETIYQRSTPCPFCTIKQLTDDNNKPNNQTLVYEFFNEVDDNWYQMQDKAITWPDGRCAKYSIAVDISGLKQAQNQLAEAHAQLAINNQKLQKFSLTDPLTQISNRLKLDEEFSREIERAKREVNTFGVIMLDIDHFKNINDTYGHQVGDDVLVEMARILSGRLRRIDCVGRWGGEEFLLICPGADMHIAKRIADSLQLQIAGNHFDGVGQVTASFGVTAYKQDDTQKDIIARVDKALYQSKHDGRNRVSVIE